MDGFFQVVGLGSSALIDRGVLNRFIICNGVSGQYGSLSTLHKKGIMSSSTARM